MRMFKLLCVVGVSLLFAACSSSSNVKNNGKVIDLTGLVPSHADHIQAARQALESHRQAEKIQQIMMQRTRR